MRSMDTLELCQTKCWNFEMCLLTSVIVFGYYKHIETVGSMWEKTAVAWQEILKVINQCQAAFFSIFCHRRHYFNP